MNEMMYPISKNEIQRYEELLKFVISLPVYPNNPLSVDLCSKDVENIRARINATAQQTPTDGKTAYSMWISERGFEQISYNPGAEEVWIAGYTYGYRIRAAQEREKVLEEVQLRLMDEMIEIGYHEPGDMWAPLKGINEAFAELRNVE